MNSGLAGSTVQREIKEKLKLIEDQSNFLFAWPAHRIRSALNKDPAQAHQAGIQLFEVTLKFFALVAAAQYRQLTDGFDAELIRKSVDALKQPSNGQWLGFLREVSTAISKSGSRSNIPYSTFVDQILKKRKDLSALCTCRIDLHNAISERRPDLNTPGLNSKSASVIDVLGLLITYRNNFHGHGFLQHEGEFSKHAAILAKTLAEILTNVELVTRAKLAYISRVEFQSDRKLRHELLVSEGRHTEFEDFSYIANQALDPGRVYLCQEKDDDRIVPWLALHPGVLFRYNNDERGDRLHLLADISSAHVGFTSCPLGHLFEPNDPQSIYKEFITSSAPQEVLIRGKKAQSIAETKSETREKKPEGPPIICGICTNSNPPGSSKCGECGAALSRVKIEESASTEIQGLVPADNPQIWERFEGVYLAYNAPFRLEKDTNLDLLTNKHAERYRNPALQRADYLFFLGKNEEERHRALLRLTNLKLFMNLLREKIPDIIDDKIKLSFTLARFPRVTFFCGRKAKNDYSILYFHDDLFMNEDMPLECFVSTDHELAEKLRGRFKNETSRARAAEVSVERLVSTDPAVLLSHLEDELAGSFRLRDEVNAISFSPTLRIHEQARVMRRRGETVYHLGFGEAPFPVHPRLRRSLDSSAGHNEYLPVAGLEELRDLVLKYHCDRLGLDEDHYEVCIAPGSKLLLFAAQQAIQGDLLLPVPSWVSYGPQARLLGDSVIPVSTNLENKHFPTTEELGRSIERARDQGRQPTKIILNSPNNPSGLSADVELLKGLANFCDREEIMVMSDEIYGFVHFNGGHRSISEWLPDSTVVVSGLSKHMSLGGWRLGVALIPRSIKGLFQAVCAIGSETWSTATAPVQYAALEAYRGHDDVEDYVKNCTSIHHKVMSWMRQQLVGCGIDYPEPDGAFYLYPDFAPFRKMLKDKYAVTSATSLSDFLLERLKIASLPAPAFGDDDTHLRLRLAGCDYDGAHALDTYSENPEIPEAEFVQTCCPNIWEGLIRLCDLLGEFKP